MTLQGKVSLITGAAGLLGIEHARALLELNSTVVLTDINYEALVNKKDALASSGFNPGEIFCLKMDVTSTESIHSAFTQLKTDGLSISVLVNNAAVDPKVGNASQSHLSRLENFPLSQWDKEVAVGLTGAFLASQVFGSNMALHGGGVILNIASDLSVIAPNQSLYKLDNLDPSEQPVKPVTYSVIKTGLVGLTKYLSTYWADAGVRCNALSPGGVYTNQPDEFVSRVSELIPMRRMAEPGEYRSAVQFLCSDASSYMTGHNLVIDGGRSVW